MKCPKCKSSDHRVTDSRSSGDNSHRRRRLCDNCGNKFTTYEVLGEFVEKRYSRPRVMKRDAKIRMIGDMRKILEREMSIL